MDLVIITGLEVATTIGAYDWEQDIKQTLIIDLELSCDVSEVAKDDDLKDAIDYAKISTLIYTIMHAATVIRLMKKYSQII